VTSGEKKDRAEARPLQKSGGRATGAKKQPYGAAPDAQVRVLKVWSSVSGRILGEDGVARSFRVAGSAGFECRLGARFTVFVEVCVSPPARRGVFF